ncbi:Inosine/uridine-preferring nucleoside hydrolase [Hypoxylon sp. FL1284]|nr:Inosine/uridine-preferring nucleoside hydrolase [Hypoxylon sp. FL1284]
MPDPVPLWLDCDPGHDDAFAILLAAYHPGIRLLGISTVHGNASLEKTTKNALAVLAAIGKQDAVSVHAGAPQALARPPTHAPADIHGESGLDGTTLLPTPAAERTAAAHAGPGAVDAMAAALGGCAPGTAWVAATGALTNVAALFAAHPELRERVAGVTSMGGSVGDGFTAAPMGVVDGVPRVGNYTQWAEFNVLIDPEAAAAVLADPVLAPKTTLVPLDLTHLVLATRDVQDLLLYGPPEDGAPRSGRGKTDLRVMLVELLNFFAATYRDVFKLTEGPPLHDPLAVAAVLAGTEHEIAFHDFDARKGQDNSRQERFAVKVITDGTLDDARHRGAQTGRTLVTPLPPGAPGVRIPRGLDVDRFWAEIEECCERADEANRKILATAPAPSA